MRIIPKKLIKLLSVQTNYYGRRNTHSSLCRYKLKKFVIKKMSYHEISNILVDSVVIPNKPLSNLEIIDAAKKLSLYEFRGVFLRDTPYKAKLNECDILNLDSSSGDGTYWVMLLKQVRISSISIVMGCNLLVS